MEKIIGDYKTNFVKKDFIISVLISLALLVASLVINFIAGEFATDKASNAVTDIVLSNIPVFNVGGIFFYGGMILFSSVAVFCLVEPKRLPFVLKSVSLFLLTRSVFISLTHIGSFPTQASIHATNALARVSFGSD